MSTTRTNIRASLSAVYPQRLVDELLDAYEESKSKFYLGGLRLSAVEGGRFSEAAFRLLEHETTGNATPLGRHLDSDRLIRNLAGLQAGSHPDSVRLHIPRALRVVFDIRNNRDAAHLADGIDPNLQDASLVVGVLDWVLAEFIRLHHGVDAARAHAMVTDLVTRRAPVIDFDGFLKVLRPSLSARDHCLVILYQRGSQGATLAELTTWARPTMRSNLRRTLYAMVHEKAWVHQSGNTFTVTQAGLLEVDARRLLDV